MHPENMKHVFVVVAGQYLFLLVILGLLVAWIRSPKDSKLRFFVSVLVVGAIAYCLSLLAAHLHHDTRPFVARHLAPLIPHGADNGFPSDHALLTMTLTAITFFFSKRTATLMFLVTILVAVARIAALIHSPQDIAGAWILGIVGAVVGYYGVRAAWPRISAIATRAFPRLRAQSSDRGE
jgi:undecaprenyl-diphosphatase